MASEWAGHLPWTWRGSQSLTDLASTDWKDGVFRKGGHIKGKFRECV